jgi:type III pantothenate kinase
MLLAIDAGNTNIVFAVFDGAKLIGSWRSATNAQRTADEHFVYLQSWLQNVPQVANKLTAAIISSVVPDATWNLRELCRERLVLEPMVIGDQRIDLGIKIMMDRPEEVGADRIVNAVAGIAQHKPPLLIIDFGTATTIDVVDTNGSYRGGVIAPGPHLSLQALHMAAAKLPRVEVAKPRQVIGTGTVSAMQSGIYWGYVAMIEGLVTRIKAELGQPAQVIATGGLAALFADATKTIDANDPDLTLRGLQLIYERNQGKIGTA